MFSCSTTSKLSPRPFPVWRNPVCVWIVHFHMSWPRGNTVVIKNLWLFSKDRKTFFLLPFASKCCLVVFLGRRITLRRQGPGFMSRAGFMGRGGLMQLIERQRDASGSVFYVENVQSKKWHLVFHSLWLWLSSCCNSFYLIFMWPSNENILGCFCTF